MDKELPWLADNAQLELKYKKGKTPLSHRNWPGEPVPVITENIIQTLGDELLQKAEKKKNIVWRYENFSLEWQSAITQAINLIGEHKPSITARTMAALACIAQNDSQQLLDEIVQQEGLEYATEVVIARQFIVRCYESDPLVVTLQYQNEDYGYGYRSETYNEFDLRLRKHLSLAEESCWQRCADKLIAALPGITKVRRPFIALNLPEKPEIANELVSLECSQTHFRSKEWLKVVADDPKAVKELARYWSQDIFSDREASYMSHENHFGDGKIVRFEEITRTPLEVQDCLLGMLSDRVMTVPELTGEASQLYAREGFNIIATANTRDRGVNEMSAALKRRFDFETVFPIMDFAQELELVASASARLLAHSGIPHKVPDAVLELLVRTFRDLRANGEKKTSMDTLTAIMSTAEAVNVAHAVGVRAWFLANRAGEPADLVDCIAGTIVKDNEEDRARLRRYFEQRVATHKEAHWQAYYQARHRLP
ncbi:MoxR family ATPase [Escherichia coli]|nr:MoxR family ATPase [Escherichia coli]